MFPDGALTSLSSRFSSHCFPFLLQKCTHCFATADGTPWSGGPETPPPPPLHADNPNHVGNPPAATEKDIATGFLPPDHPGREMIRYCKLQYECRLFPNVSIENAERLQNCP